MFGMMDYKQSNYMKYDTRKYFCSVVSPVFSKSMLVKLMDVGFLNINNWPRIEFLLKYLFILSYFIIAFVSIPLDVCVLAKLVK